MTETTSRRSGGKVGINLHSATRWKRQFTVALMTLLITLFAVTSATFAWYIYNANAHTTHVKMAAGTSSKLQISNTYTGDKLISQYSSSTQLDNFTGVLNPVSTNSIQLGFRKVAGFTNGSENRTNVVANLFAPAETADYYKTQLFLCTNGAPLDVYLAEIGYEDADSSKPISAAIRLGLVVHEPGENAEVEDEFIFAINTEDVGTKNYNTYTGEEGYVLDLTSENTEAVVKFDAYTEDNFCEYDRNTGQAEVKQNAVRLCTVAGPQSAEGGYSGEADFIGEMVQIDVYIWLEGCDQHCTNDLVGATLSSLTMTFAGIPQ